MEYKKLKDLKTTDHVFYLKDGKFVVDVISSTGEVIYTHTIKKP